MSYPRHNNNSQTGPSSLIFGVNGLGGGLSSSTRHLHICQQSPSPSPSPWSSCSSAIPSPLMPPPPLSAAAPSSSGTTMMMAMSSMVTVEPEKWNTCGSGSTWDSYAYRRQPQHENHSTRSHQSELPESQNMSGFTPRSRVASCGGDRESIRIGGMVSTGSLDREHTEQHQQPSSASASSTHSLYPGTSVMPWLLPETRTRSHSFDVTRVFTSSTGSHNSIKPNQRTLVQSMFKDVSTENIWTTTSVSQLQLQQGQGHLLIGQLGQPSPQPMSALSLGRYGSASPLSYFHSMTTSMNNSNAGMVPPSPSMGIIGGGLYSSKDADIAGGWNMGGEEEGGSSSSGSLTSRLLRRRGSGDRMKFTPGGTAAGYQEKSEKERRRNSATAAIAGTLSLNFRKSSDPQHHSSSSNSIHRRRPSIPEAFVVAAAAATGTQDDYHMKSEEGTQGQNISVKARAQVIEKKSSFHDAFLTSVTSSSPLCKKKIKSKVSSLHLRGHKESSSSLVVDEENAVAPIASGMATRTTGDQVLSMGSDMEMLETLSSVGEIARSRRGASGSERITRKGVPLEDNCGLKSASSSYSLPATLRSANSSASSLVSLQPVDTTKESVEKIWTAMGRIIHKSGRSRNNSSNSGGSVSPNDIHGSYSSQGQSLHHQHHQQQPQQNQRPTIPSTTIGSTLLRRSSTVKSGRSSETSCTLTSSSTSPSSYSPTLAPHPCSIRSPCSPQNPKKSRLRTDSISTIQSLKSDTETSPEPSESCGTGSGALGKANVSFTPPKLRLTPSLSITCSSSDETSPDCPPMHPVSKKQDSSYSSSPQTQKKEHSHHLFFQHHNQNHDHRRQETYTSQTHAGQTQAHPQLAPATSVPSHDRRKSLSILQNITHSASQKFKTLMWSPSGLRKKTVMSLSPIMMDQPSGACSGGGTTDEEEAVGREENEDRENGECLSLPETAPVV